MKSRIVAVLIVILASAPAWADKGWQIRYVNADVANVRKDPQLSSEIVARLRINSQVVQHHARDGWAEVSWVDILSGQRGIPERRRRGFVRDDLLGAKAANLADALARAQAALGSGATAVAVQWAERAFALDGLNPDARALLRAAYDEVGEEEKSARLARNLDGREPAFLAICREQRVEFLAQHDPVRGLLPVDVGSPSNPSPVARDLGGLAWFSLTPDGQQRAVYGGEFSFPRVVHRANEHLDGEVPELSTEEGKLVLGLCNQEGTLYATAPLSTVKREEFDWNRALSAMAAIREKAGLSGEGGEGVRVVSIAAARFRDPMGWEATLEVDYPRPAGDIRLAFWALGGEGDSLLSTLGWAGGHVTDSVQAVWWGLLGHYRLGVATTHYSKEEAGSRVSASIFVVDPAGRVRSLEVELKASGC